MQTKVKPLLTKWQISPGLQAKMDKLDETDAWLNNPEPGTLAPYRGKYIAARDCKILAAADTYGELEDLLKGEDPETYLIMQPSQ